MEKRKSLFSIKTVRFLVFSFTTSFSIIFLIFLCSSWVFKTSTSSHYTSSSLTAQISLSEFRNSSSEFYYHHHDVLHKNSILKKTRFKRDDVYSQVADFPSGVGLSKDSSGSDSNEAVVVDSDGQKEGFLDGNFSLTPFSKKNFSVDSVNTSEEYSNDSPRVVHVTFTQYGVSSSSSSSNLTANEQFQELDEVIVDTKKENSLSKGELDLVSEVSFKRKYNNPLKNIEEKGKKLCDITKGKWVFDKNYPLYTNATCPFIDEGFNCEGNGRLDKDYMKWRWQPQDCDIPRFNATNMLELIRGKRLVFVGDSINRNQWESMLCLLMSGIKDPKKVYEARGRAITKERGNYCFKFVDYKCTVEYYVSHFLVHESKARIGNKKRVQTLRIDTIDKGSSRWRGADILVFNTAHWWSHHKTKAGINYYQEGDLVHPLLDVTTAYRRSLSTWASWIDKYIINPRKTRVFFRSSAPSHFSGGQWNSGGHCREALRPIINETSFTSGYPEKNLIVEEIISGMMNRATLLNITSLSDYRPDAHPSIYGRKSRMEGVQDCSHWCLPGVPDMWNELLYYYYLQLTTKDIYL